MRMLATLTLPGLLALSACADSPAERFAAAQADYARSDFAAARVALNAALREEPGDPAMLALLARTQLRLRDVEGAEGTLAHFAGKLDTAETARLAAELALLKGNAQAALDALAEQDRSPTAWRIRAEAWLALGNDARASEAFSQGMAAGPDVQLAAAYARYLLASGELARAVAIHRTMLGFAPEAFETIVLEGDLAAARGDGDRAAAAFRRASTRYPQRPEPLLALAMQLEAAGKPKEALKLVEQASELAGDTPEVIEAYVHVLATQGQWDKVRATLMRGEATLDPTSAIGQTYGEALLRLGQPEQARKLFSRARLLRPSDAYAAYMLGEAQLATGDPAAAWRTLEPLSRSMLAPRELVQAALRSAEAIEAPEAGGLRARLQPARWRREAALAERAQEALARQNWQAAEAALMALPGGQDDPEVLIRIATARSRQRNTEGARIAAERALALAPGNAEYLHAAGLVRLEAGDRATARLLLQQAAEADPRDRTIQRDLAKASA